MSPRTFGADKSNLFSALKCLAFAIGIGGLTLFLQAQLWLFALVVSLSLLCAGLFLLIYFRRKIVVDDHGVRVTGLLRGIAFEAPWNEITKLEPFADEQLPNPVELHWSLGSTKVRNFNLLSTSPKLEQILRDRLFPQALPGSAVDRVEIKSVEYHGTLSGSDHGLWLLIHGALMLFVASFCVLYLCQSVQQLSKSILVSAFMMAVETNILWPEVRQAWLLHRSKLDLTAEGVAWQARGKSGKIFWNELTYAAVSKGTFGRTDVLLLTDSEVFAAATSGALAEKFVLAVRCYAPNGTKLRLSPGALAGQVQADTTA